MKFLIILVTFIKLATSTAPRQGDLRVFKGKNDSRAEFPFAVTLQLMVEPHQRFCTGSIIAEQWVLTAAHCLPKNLASRMGIRYGDFTKPATETKLYSRVIQIYPHPNYIDEYGLNDIALVHTDRLPDNRVKILALDYRTLFGLPVKYAGFGYSIKKFKPTREEVQNTQSMPLQVGEGIIVPCKNVMRFMEVMCVSPKCSEKTQQVRPGDSGGPLVYNGKVIGVARSLVISVPVSEYTAISPYIQWIRNTIIPPAEQTRI